MFLASRSVDVFQFNCDKDIWKKFSETLYNGYVTIFSGHHMNVNVSVQHECLPMLMGNYNDLYSMCCT